MGLVSPARRSSRTSAVRGRFKGVLTLEQLVALMHGNPARRFGFGTPLAEGEPADLTVFDLGETYTVDPGPSWMSMSVKTR